MWENQSWYGNWPEKTLDEEPDLEFPWPLEVVASDLAYTSRELAAWKREHIERDRFCRVLYARMSLEGIGRPGRVRRAWNAIKLFSPLIALAVAAHFVGLAPVAVLSCAVLPIQLIALGSAIHRAVHELVIGTFVKLEREHREGENGRDGN